MRSASTSIYCRSRANLFRCWAFARACVCCFFYFRYYYTYKQKLSCDPMKKSFATAPSKITILHTILQRQTEGAGMPIQLLSGVHQQARITRPPLLP